MNSFGRELSKALMKRLPQSNEYGWSRRVEGALVRSEETAAHSHVVIIIDCEISETNAAPILGEIIRFVTSNQYFRKSKYRVFLWEHGGFTLMPPLKVSARELEQHLAKVADYDTMSGNWENFAEIYTPHKKAGQTMLITTADKIATLKNTPTARAKNLLILYPADDGKNGKLAVAGIPCVGYKNDTCNVKGE